MSEVASIRLAAVAPRFHHGGFDLTRTWSSFDELTAQQRETLKERHGRWIRVHPHDRDKLERYCLRFVSGQDPLEELDQPEVDGKVEATDQPANEPVANTKNDTKAKTEKASRKG